MPRVPDGVDLGALRAEQAELAADVRIEDDLPGTIERVAGFDASYNRSGTGYGALVVLDAGSLEPIQQHTTTLDVELPYIPGLLAYRELPLATELWAKLSREPDVLLVDGGGLIHPRRIGSASHMGLRFDVPSIGITKRLLLGEVDGELSGFGDTAPVVEDRERIGYAWRSSRRATKPIYVSPGHRVTAERALEIAQALATGEHKLPEPVRVADRLAGELRRSTV